MPAPPRPPSQPRWWRFFLPVTTDAATFKVDDKTIRVAGVDVAAGRCDLSDCADGSDGRAVRRRSTRFAVFLHGRAVECYFPRDDGAADIIAPCRVGADRPRRCGCLTQGWARPDDLATDDYRECRRGGASARGRGIWRGQTPPRGLPDSRRRVRLRRRVRRRAPARSARASRRCRRSRRTSRSAARAPGRAAPGRASRTRRPTRPARRRVPCASASW